MERDIIANGYLFVWEVSMSSLVGSGFICESIARKERACFAPS